MKAMIFAAGFGKRLRPITRSRPKALVEVKGVPLLDWVIRHLISHGIREIIINTHYLAEHIRRFLSVRTYPIPVTTVFEESILGTGGGLFNTIDFWGENDFLVCNADILSNVNLADFIASHHADGHPVTLAVNDWRSSSMLLVDGERKLVGREGDGVRTIASEPKGSVRKVGFCGYHMVSPMIFSLVKFPVDFSIIDIYMRLLNDGVSISTWCIGDSYWRDVGTPQALRFANLTFPGID